MRTCHMADDIYCEGGTNKECFACGQPVCGNCSVKVKWSMFGTKRICFSCAEEEYPVQVSQRRRVLLGVTS